MIKSIRERDFDDCATAVEWLKGILPSETMDQISEMAYGLRSTSRAMSFLVPLFESRIDEQRSKALIMELSALATEAYVRAANELWPKAGEN